MVWKHGSNQIHQIRFLFTQPQPLSDKDGSLRLFLLTTLLLDSKLGAREISKQSANNLISGSLKSSFAWSTDTKKQGSTPKVFAGWTHLDLHADSSSLSGICETACVVQMDPVKLGAVIQNGRYIIRRDAYNHQRAFSRRARVLTRDTKLEIRTQSQTEMTLLEYRDSLKWRKLKKYK